jgi:transposase
MSRKPTRKFTDEFRQQMVQLYNSGKPSSEIVKEYDLTASAFHSWVKKYNKTGSFKAVDNLTPEQKELIELRKQNKQLLMENDILKQAALIMGRK